MYLIGIVSFTLSLIGVMGIRRWALARNLLDLPNERSSHVIPTPRVGGFAIAAVVLVGFMLTNDWSNRLSATSAVGYISGAVLIAAISAADDVFRISAQIRFVVHFAAGAIMVLSTGFFDLVHLPLAGDLGWGLLGIPITLLWVVGLTNAYNFMDGIDAIAAGQAIVSAALWYMLASLMNLQALAILSMLVAGASLGFLVFNLPPARIFMGDVGSTVLGYTLASVPLMASRETGDTRLFVVGVLGVAPFIFDTVLTMMRRALKREHLLEAHRTHLYQRLVKMGYSHGQVTTVYVLLAIASSVAGLVFYQRIGWISDYIVFLAILLLTANAVCVTWIERRHMIGLPR